MDSQNSWIDRREITELLRQLLPDPAPEDESGGDSEAPLVDAFIPSEDDEPISLLGRDTPSWEDAVPYAQRHPGADPLREKALESLEAIRPFTSGAFHPGDTDLPPFPPESEPAPAPPEFDIPDGCLATRLRAFAAWVCRITGGSQILITDAQGYSLLDTDTPENATTVSSALQLLEALDKFRHRMQTDRARSGLYLPLGREEWFGVIECNSTLGPVCLSLILPAPLAADAAQKIAQILRRTLET